VPPLTYAQGFPGRCQHQHNARIGKAPSKQGQQAENGEQRGQWRGHPLQTHQPNKLTTEITNTHQIPHYLMTLSPIDLPSYSVTYSALSSFFSSLSLLFSAIPVCCSASCLLPASLVLPLLAACPPRVGSPVPDHHLLCHPLPALNRFGVGRVRRRSGPPRRSRPARDSELANSRRPLSRRRDR
jgi:hypothetical protein